MNCNLSYSYIDFLPLEIIELIIPYLNNNELSEFLTVYNIQNILNWETIYYLHFGNRMSKDFNAMEKFQEYLTPLSVERLKEKLKLKWSVKEIHSLYNNNISKMPKEIGELKILKQLYLMNNKIKSLPETVVKLINL